MSLLTARTDRAALTPEQMLLTDHIGNEVYASHYAERKAYRLIIGCGTILLLGSIWLNFSLAHRPITNRYIRIDEMGRAQAIAYSDLNYSPREGEVRTYLTDWANYRYTISRDTVAKKYPLNYYFLSQTLASQLMTDDNANHFVSQVVGGQIEQSDVEVKNVTITSMSEETVQGAKIARGTALVTLDRLYSSHNSREPRTEHWAMTVTYYLNPKQVSDQAKIFPQFEIINPLGLTVTEFHENRLSVDPIATWDCRAYAVASQPNSSGRFPMSYHLILPFFPDELRELLLDPSISDLMINGTTGVFADRNGIVQHIPLASPYTNERLQAAIERVARILGQDLSSQNPILNTRLPDGSRVAVVGAPSSINGPTLTIRKFNRWYTSDELIASGSLPSHVRNEVVSLMNAKKNGIISGGTGSGKTTLMKALLDHVPEHERLVVIEQPAELKVSHLNAVRWEAVEAIPGQVAITPSQLLAAALRHRPDRIIMGEIRDECGYDLLQAMNTGHGGTLSTIHAKSAWDALNRLSDLALSARANLNHAFIRSETAEAIDFVLYCERDQTGRRRVRELVKVNGYTHADQSFQTEDIYRASAA